LVPEVRSLSIKERKCRFIDEYEGIMKIFKFYTRYAPLIKLIAYNYLALSLSSKYI